jgi:hypothetical protein
MDPADPGLAAPEIDERTPADLIEGSMGERLVPVAC